MLRKGNRVGIKEVLAQNNANRDNIIMLVKEHMGEIPMSMISDLNKILQTELQVEDVSDME